MTKAIITVRLFDTGETIDTHTIASPVRLLGSASPQSYADALARLRQSQTGLPCYGTVA